MSQKLLLKDKFITLLLFFAFLANGYSQFATLEINGNFTFSVNGSGYWSYRYKPTGSSIYKQSNIITYGTNSTITLNPFLTWDFSTCYYNYFGQLSGCSPDNTINPNYKNISKSVGYSFDFNTPAVNEGWRGYKLTPSTSNYYYNISESTYNANGGSGKSIFMEWEYGRQLILVSPKINDLSTDKKFSIFASAYQGNSTIEMGTITDPYDPSTFHPLKTTNLTGSTYTKIEVYLNNYNGQDKYIAFRNTGYYGAFYLDDFSYEQSVNCFDNSNLSISNINEDNVTLNFIADSQQNNWELELKDVTHNSTQTLNINSYNNYLLKNLTGNTSYEIKIRANCAQGLYSNWTPIQTFKTPCASISSGYTTSFLDTSYFNPCWTKLGNGGFIYQRNINNNDNNDNIKPRTGNTFIQMSNSYASLTQKSFIISPHISDLDNKKRIKFFLISRASGFDYNNTPLTIGTISNPNDPNTFLPLKTILPEEMNEIDGYKTNDYWKEHIVYLDNYDNSLNHHYIAIEQNNLDNNCNFYIDDFTYESIPICKEPVNLKLIKSDFESAKVTWENNNVPNNGEWEIQYGISGFTIGTGITVSSPTNTTTLSNLLGFTNYDFYVRSKCGNTYSNWSDRGFFKTRCSGVTTGYTYDFENDSFDLNSCWSRTTIEKRDKNYIPRDVLEYTNVEYGTPKTHSGTQMLKFNKKNHNENNVSEKNILITPRLIDLNNEKKISFWAYFASYTTSVITSMQIGTLSDPDDYNTFIPYESIPNSAFKLNQWYKYTIDLSKYYGTNKFIGIRFIDNDRNNYTVFIDDFEYTNNDCLRPSSLTAAQNNTNSAVLSWNTNNNNPIDCEIEYGPIGFAPGTGTIITTKTIPFVINNLKPNTEYQYRVRNICTNNTVNWSNLYDFKISCAVNVPYEENFDNYTYLNQTITPDFCWSINLKSNKDGNGMIREYHIENFNSSPNCYFLEHTNIHFDNPNDLNKQIYLISPYLSDFSSFKKVKFWINNEHKNSQQILTIGTLSNPLDTTTFTPYQILDTSNMPAYGREINVDFSNYTGTNKFVAFVLSGNDFSNTYYIDDFKYQDHNTCLEPVNIRFLNISDKSTLIKWDNANSEKVEIEYGISGFKLGTGTKVNTNLNEILITNLISSTNYDFYLKTICASGQSITVNKKKITTACDVKQVPWKETFSNMSKYGEDLLPECISKLGEITVSSYNSPVYLTWTNFYRFDSLLNGNGDNTFLWIRGDFFGIRGVITPTFNLKAGTTYKFSVDGRKSYEYDSQYLRLHVGRGNMMHYMEAELETIGNLSEYSYKTNSFIFTPLTSGEYSFILEAAHAFSSNLILDNLSLKEGYENIITNNTELFDFENGVSNKLVIESTLRSLVNIETDEENNSNSLLKFNGNEYYDYTGWMTNQRDSWISNQNSITKVNMKIDASKTKSLFMLFDLKQTFNTNSDESMFRVVVNGNVIGDVIKPNTSNLDTMSTLQYDLTPYIGGFINISLQHIGKSAFKAGEIGDNAYLDNLKFSSTPSQLSIDQNSLSEFKYFPNPVDAILNIENNSIINKVEMFSVTGQSVFKQEYNENKISIDTKKIPNGIYFFKITSEKENTVAKIIISH